MTRLPGETPEAETGRLRDMVRILGTTVTALSRSLKAAWIELEQGNPGAAKEWIANAVPGEVWDGDQWDGKESAQEWAGRTDPAEATP
jgi:hypothetical protein